MKKVKSLMKVIDVFWLIVKKSEDNIEICRRNGWIMCEGE